MGYSSITYLIIAAVLFFIPYCFLVTEMSLSFKNERGGIFSWMSKSVNESYGLIGTMMWYGAIVVMWLSASSIAIQLSVTLFGSDTTSKWHLFSLNSSATISIIGAIYMIITGFMSTKGLKK